MFAGLAANIQNRKLHPRSYCIQYRLKVGEQLPMLKSSNSYTLAVEISA